MQQHEREQCIERIAALPGKLRALVAGLEEEQLSAHTFPGEWNVAQNVHHLADSHMYAFLQVRSGLTADNPLIGNYEQDRFAALADSCGPPVSDSLDLLDCPARPLGCPVALNGRSAVCAQDAPDAG